jgi:hypothetical protein
MKTRSAEYSQNTGLLPVTERILRFQAHETPDAKLAKLEHALSQYRLPLEESVPLFAPLLSLPMPENHYPPLNLSPQRQRQMTLETIIALLLAPIYGWFTEGFDTADLQEAKALLEELWHNDQAKGLMSDGMIVEDSELAPLHSPGEQIHGPLGERPASR